MSFAFNKHRRRGDAGVTSLEVAVIFGVFIVLVFSIIDLSRYLFSQQALTTLVTATARQGFAGTLPAFCNGASLPQTETQVAAFAPLLDFNRITSLAMCVDQGSGVTVLTVTASYSFQPITPLIEAMLGPASTMTASMTYSY
jgi:Flp pilus assembly protein TadG